MGRKRLNMVAVRRIVALVALVLLSVLPEPAMAVEGADDNTYLSFRSDPGDYIGAGQTRTWYPADGSFSASHGTGYVGGCGSTATIGGTSTSRPPTARS